MSTQHRTAGRDPDLDPIKLQALRVIDAVGLSARSQAYRLASAFIESMANSYSARTYAYHLGPWLEACRSRNLDPLAATPLDAMAYAGRIGHLAPCTQETRLAVIRSFYEVALTNDHVRRNPFRTVKGPKRLPPDLTAERATPRISKEAFDSVLSKIATKTDSSRVTRNAFVRGCRDYTLIYFFGRVGWRAFQGNWLTWGARQVDDDGVYLTVIRKGGGSSNIYLLDDLVEALDAWAAVLEEALGRPLRADDAIFPAFHHGVSGTAAMAADRGVPPLGRRSISAVCKKRLADVSLTGRRFAAHLFRATSVSIARAEGADLETCRMLLGHRNSRTTQLYLPPTKDHLPAAALWRPDAPKPGRTRPRPQALPAPGLSQ